MRGPPQPHTPQFFPSGNQQVVWKCAVHLLQAPQITTPRRVPRCPDTFRAALFCLCSRVFLFSQCPMTKRKAAHKLDAPAGTLTVQLRNFSMHQRRPDPSPLSCIGCELHFWRVSSPLSMLGSFMKKPFKIQTMHMWSVSDGGNTLFSPLAVSSIPLC